jgi:hypothetical protein
MHLERSGTMSKTIQLMTWNWQQLFTLLKSGDIILWVLSVTFTLTIRASNISLPKQFKYEAKAMVRINQRL